MCFALYLFVSYISTYLLIGKIFNKDSFLHISNKMWKYKKGYIWKSF